MKKCLQFSVTSILQQVIEIVLPKLEIEENPISHLPIELKAGSSKADIKCLGGQLVKYMRTGITIIIS